MPDPHSWSARGHDMFDTYYDRWMETHDYGSLEEWQQQDLNERFAELIELADQDEWDTDARGDWAYLLTELQYRNEMDLYDVGDTP